MTDKTLERAAKMTIAKWRAAARNKYGNTKRDCGFCVCCEDEYDTESYFCSGGNCPLYNALGKYCTQHKFYRNWRTTCRRKDYARARYWATRIADALENLAVRKKWIAKRKGE